MTAKLAIETGRPHPLGATPDADGVNFSLLSTEAKGVHLLLFENHDDPEPFQTIALDPIVNHTFYFWHVFVRDLKPGSFYAYRVDGPFDPGAGQRFDPQKVLIDPYARGHTDTLWNRRDACGSGDNVRTARRSVVIDARRYDWESDRPPRTPMKDAIIYEMHVRGFTQNPNSAVASRGVFAGVVEKIPYLKELGVTAVELMPVFEFDSKEIIKTNPDGSVLKNYWGYNPIAFFAPESSYCVAPEVGGHLDEFRDMVKALHRAGLEVILDVVFNHTSEGNELGPTISFRGLDNAVYYHLPPSDKQHYMDYSGCGNTVNCNHPIVGKYVLDCLGFWAREMHVDGFRFDEGSVLSRGEDGAPLAHPPLPWAVELANAFVDTKLIAEAWDAGGLYQIGGFAGFRWAEWNGRFRDDLRRFLKGDPGFIGAAASRIAGSSDIYQCSRHSPLNSLNFIACHDGFTLMDLVSYNAKHNQANGEDNRDGSDCNWSWNSGVEGETDDPAIRRFRKQRIKNFAAALLLSQGVPMILSGDEVGRTQRGNNNPYCQDNEISWFDWSLLRTNRDLFDFFRRMIALRRSMPALRRGRFFDGAVNARGLKDLEWRGVGLGQADWDDPAARALAFTMGGFAADEPDLHVMMNMDWQPQAFAIPPGPGGRRWRRFADTALEPPEDIVEPGEELSTPGGDSYVLQPYSVVILTARGS